MSKLVPGLGLWWVDVEHIIDGFALGHNPDVETIETRHRPRPDEIYTLDAIELQVGDTTHFTEGVLTSGPFSSKRFEAKATAEFLDVPMHLFYPKGINHLPSMRKFIREAAVHQTLNWVRSKQFRGVHSSDGCHDNTCGPRGRVDLADPDPTIAKRSLEHTVSLLRLAQAVNATSYVFHPTSSDFLHDGNDKRWLGGPDEKILRARSDRKMIFFNSLDRLIHQYKKEGFTTPLVIENLEFPKFPSTSEELVQMYHGAVEMAKRAGLPADTIKVCFDWQHMRHTYKILNEAQNRSGYERINAIDSYIPGFHNSGREFLGKSYHPNWQEAIRRNPGDSAQMVFDQLGKSIAVIHLAGNYESARMDVVDETQGAVLYKDNHDNLPRTILNTRRAVYMMIKQGLNVPIIIEDQTPGHMKGHLRSAEALNRYIAESRPR